MIIDLSLSSRFSVFTLNIFWIPIVFYSRYSYFVILYIVLKAISYIFFNLVDHLFQEGQYLISCMLWNLPVACGSVLSGYPFRNVCCVVYDFLPRALQTGCRGVGRYWEVVKAFCCLIFSCFTFSVCFSWLSLQILWTGVLFWGEWISIVFDIPTPRCVPGGIERNLM